MSKKAAIIISPNWRDYAEKYLADCLDSLRKQDWVGESKIFLIDNETNNKSFAFLKDMAPDCEIIRNIDNAGFAKGNNVAIKKALAQGFEYIILINMDTIVEQGCIRGLIEVADSDDKIGAVQARLMLWPDKEKINSLGNKTHFLGFGYCEGYDDKFPISNFQFSIKDIAYPSGAAVLFKANVLREIGLFDEEFWMYNEDQDLGWRVWLAGFKCVLAPSAVVYHKYEFSRSIKKYYWMDRNRILVMLKNYHWLTLILIAPAFLVMEFGLFIFSFKTGWLKQKISVYKYFFNFQKWGYILNARRASQSLRKRKDRDIIKMFSGRIWYQEVGDWKLRLINPVFELYWKIAKRIIVW